MKHILLILALVCTIAAPRLATAQDIPVTINIGPAGFNCGPYTSPLSCANIPIVLHTATGDVYGSFSFRDGATSHYVSFYLPTFEYTLYYATIPVGEGVGNCSFAGVTADGHTYSGTMDLTTATIVTKSGGGRAGGGRGTKLILTGGTMSLEIN